MGGYHDEQPYRKGNGNRQGDYRLQGNAVCVMVKDIVFFSDKDEPLKGGKVKGLKNPLFAANDRILQAGAFRPELRQERCLFLGFNVQGGACHGQAAIAIHCKDNFSIA